MKKFTLVPLVTLLFGASYLVANAAAYSYNDHNELDARYQIDGVLSERGFGHLEARETVDVPFQPSLRAFLEGAVTAHRRSISEDEKYLEARADNKIEVHAIIVNTDNKKKLPKVSVKVKPNILILMFIDAVEKALKTRDDPDNENLSPYTLILKDVALTPQDYPHRMSMRLNELGVKHGDTIRFEHWIPWPTPVSSQGMTLPLRTQPPKPTQRP